LGKEKCPLNEQLGEKKNHEQNIQEKKKGKDAAQGGGPKLENFTLWVKTCWGSKKIVNGSYADSQNHPGGGKKNILGPKPSKVSVGGRKDSCSQISVVEANRGFFP